VFRRRAAAGAVAGHRVAVHPVTTILFVAVSWLVVLNRVYRYPAHSVIGLVLMAAGLPVYLYWKRRS